MGEAAEESLREDAPYCEKCMLDWAECECDDACPFCGEDGDMCDCWPEDGEFNDDEEY